MLLILLGMMCVGSFCSLDVVWVVGGNYSVVDGREGGSR
jgi:hypothetical protein